MWTNRTKERMAAGEPVYGPFIRMPGPAPVQQAGLAGFDFVLIDGEHSSLSLEQVEVAIYSALAAGITPLVRWPYPTRPALQRVLDIGAQGIMVPHVDTEAEAATIGDAVRFPLAGGRGVAGPVLGNSWGEGSAAQNTAHFDRQVLTLAQIETAEALAKVDKIAAQPGVDVLFVGPMDLSYALGAPGEVNHPRLVEATQKVIAAAERAGKQAGIYVGSADGARFWKERGVLFFAVGLDTAVLCQAFTDLRSAIG